MMPLNEQEILLRNVLERLFQCEVVLNVPDAQMVIHAASDEPFTGRIELAKFYSLRVTLKLTNSLRNIKLGQQTLSRL